MKSRTPWVVVDAVKQEMRCDRCHYTEPMSRINGVRLDFAVEIMKGFVKLHKNCKQNPS